MITVFTAKLLIFCNIQTIHSRKHLSTIYTYIHLNLFFLLQMRVSTYISFSWTMGYVIYYNHEEIDIGQ